MNEAQVAELIGLLSRIAVALESQNKIATATHGAIAAIQTAVQSLANQAVNRR
jgi:hypothetical protein